MCFNASGGGDPPVLSTFVVGNAVLGPLLGACVVLFLKKPPFVSREAKPGASRRAIVVTGKWKILEVRNLQGYLVATGSAQPSRGALSLRLISSSCHALSLVSPLLLSAPLTEEPMQLDNRISLLWYPPKRPATWKCEPKRIGPFEGSNQKPGPGIPVGQC